MTAQEREKNMPVFRSEHFPLQGVCGKASASEKPVSHLRHFEAAACPALSLWLVPGPTLPNSTRREHWHPADMTEGLQPSRGSVGRVNHSVFVNKSASILFRQCAQLHGFSTHCQHG